MRDPDFKNHVLVCLQIADGGTHLFGRRMDQTQANAHARVVLEIGVPVVPLKQPVFVRQALLGHTVADAEAGHTGCFLANAMALNWGNKELFYFKKEKYNKELKLKMQQKMGAVN